IGDRRGEGIMLNNIGSIYDNLGQYARALEFYEQSLAIRQEIGDRRGEGTMLSNVGNVYASLGQYSKALEFYEQSLSIRQEIGDRYGEGESLNDIGSIYDSLDQYSKALKFHEQSLSIRQEIGDRYGEGESLNDIGGIYDSMGRYSKALEFFEQSLAIRQEIGDRRGEGDSFNNIGYALESLEYPVLAIVYFKQAVNAYEIIRTDIRDNEQILDQDSQQSFTEEVADSYRKLADLLLQQDRILEAQRVLDLLKVQELDDYLRGVRSETTTESGIALLPQETEFLTNQESILARAIPIATELQELRKIPFPKRSAEQKKRIQFLENQQSNILNQFLDFIASDEVQQLIAQLSRNITDPNQDVITELNQFPTLRDNLRDIGNAVLLYPLILENRLELVLVTVNSPPTRHPVSISRDQLTTKISNFQQLLRDKNSNPQPLAQELYTLLIAPLEAALTAAEAEIIIYAPDGLLRYIPLAALHDGNQWLAQRYEVNHITAASLTDLNLKPSKEPIVLAGAFQTGQHDIAIGDQTLRFKGLPFAGIEVDLLQESFPTTPFYDADFSRAATEPLMNDHTIVHLATHASLLIGDPSESFILFGNGERLTLEELKGWRGRLQTVDLMVLSACETGTGGSIKDSTGEEILGFGYLMQDAGARAVLSSLWPVSDGGTQELMTNFYEALKVKGISKAEALQQAQIAMITGNKIDAGSRERFELRPRNPAAEALSNNSLSHPYYWAPFILIGNGL
ncbi:MAG: CHAT domain-containing protein, partial [Cyanobacteria bacterium P01_F01_bin.116]